MCQTEFTNANAYLDGVITGTANGAIWDADSDLHWYCLLDQDRVFDRGTGLARRPAQRYVISTNGGSVRYRHTRVRSSSLKASTTADGGIQGTNIGYPGIHDTLAEGIVIGDDRPY